jgi:uncharacterized protein YjaG (DUF416 family)
MSDFDNDNLKQRLDSLSKEKQLGFVLLLCERLMPALHIFASETGFNDSIYRECVHVAWQYLSGTTSLLNSGELADNCLNAAPDTERFEHPLTSAALNAALSVRAVTRFLSDHDVKHVLEVAGLARDDAALHAQSIEATPPYSLDFEEIIKHPLVQQELRRQADDLQFMESLPMDISQEVIRLMKAYAQQARKAN